MLKVLLIDPDAQRAAGIEAVMRFLDHDVAVLPYVGDFRSIDDGGQFALALLAADSDGNGWQLALSVLREEASHLPVFLLAPARLGRIDTNTANASVLGTLELPLRQAQFVAALKLALTHNAQSRNRSAPATTVPRLVGQSRSMQQVHRLVAQAAASNANVVIFGEAGTGKEVVARNIHAQSPRRGMPFVPINCRSIPADLLESELFGHGKGAFAGAISARQGRFELAQGGTLFLDDIGGMSLHMQARLLRALQERRFQRIGSNQTRQVDVRIIAAADPNLKERIAQTQFCADLFHCLNDFPIDLPALRNRPGDIPVLIEELVRRIEDEGRGSVRFSAAALSVLSQYHWPGNVRELVSLVERLAILYPYQEVQVDDLPETLIGDVPVGASKELAPAERPTDEIAREVVAGPSTQPSGGLPDIDWKAGGIDLKEFLSDLEVGLIRQALDHAEGVVAHAAKLLGLRRTTLVEKLRKYGIQRVDGLAEHGGQEAGDETVALSIGGAVNADY